MDLELLSIQMITAAGDAKSCYMEALQEAKLKNYDKAKELIEEGNSSFSKGHHLHSELIQKEAAGEPTKMSLLLTHVEDQMMSTEVIKIMVVEMIELYKKLDK